MPIADQVRSAARVPFGVLRSCVTAVDRRVGPALSNTPVLGAVVSRVRDVAEHAHGGDEKTPVERTPAGQPSSEPSQQDPEQELEPATTAERENVMPERSPEDQVEQLAEDYLEAETDHQAGELADNDELRRVQAELRAKHTLQERDES